MAETSEASMGEGDTIITLATRSFFRGTVVERQRRTRAAIELAVSESTVRSQQPLQARLQWGAECA